MSINGIKHLYAVLSFCSRGRVASVRGIRARNSGALTLCLPLPPFVLWSLWLLVFLCVVAKMTHGAYWSNSVCSQIQDWREWTQGQGLLVSLIFCLYFLMLLLFLSLLLHLKPQWYKMFFYQLDQFWMLIQCWNITVSSYMCLDTLIYRSGACVSAEEISTFVQCPLW